MFDTKRYLDKIRKEFFSYKWISDDNRIVTCGDIFELIANRKTDMFWTKELELYKKKYGISKNYNFLINNKSVDIDIFSDKPHYVSVVKLFYYGCRVNQKTESEINARRKEVDDYLAKIK